MRPSVTGLFSCATIFSACNSLLKRETGILECFWGVIFHHFPMKNNSNLSDWNNSRGDHSPVLEEWKLWEDGWYIGVLLKFEWPKSSTPWSPCTEVHWVRGSCHRAACEKQDKALQTDTASAQQSTSAGLYNLQPWQTWACRCRGWRRHKGLPNSLLRGQEGPSLIFNVLSCL